MLCRCILLRGQFASFSAEPSRSDSRSLLVVTLLVWRRRPEEHKVVVVIVTVMVSTDRWGKCVYLGVEERQTRGIVNCW